MDKERYNQIIDEEYDNYRTKAKLSQIPTDLTKEEFVELCKNDITFSVYWGLKLEERELSDEESVFHYEKELYSPLRIIDQKIPVVPTKLITLTYNNEIIESYE